MRISSNQEKPQTLNCFLITMRWCTLLRSRLWICKVSKSRSARHGENDWNRTLQLVSQLGRSCISSWLTSPHQQVMTCDVWFLKAVMKSPKLLFDWKPIKIPKGKWPKAFKSCKKETLAVEQWRWNCSILFLKQTWKREAWKAIKT